MATIDTQEYLTYDDVLLVPQYSEIKSRADIDITVTANKDLFFEHPIIPANMKTICGFDMAKFIAESGGLAIIHRFMPIQEQFDLAVKFKELSNNEFNYLNHVGFSIGIKKEDYDNVDNFVKNYNVKIICIDIAHGDSNSCHELCRYISSNYPNVFLIAGNVATGSAAERLWHCGADVVKVGIGGGSLCTTRIETGNGVPQLSAIKEVYEAKNKLEVSLNRKLFTIADGGIKTAGDCVKALVFSDFVMAGNVFAGTDEAPGETLTIDGKNYKSYVGSSTHKTNRVEGVAALVPSKGPAKNILTKFIEGIQSGCSYQGAQNLYYLRIRAKFIRITNNGLSESKPHNPHVI